MTTNVYQHGNAVIKVYRPSLGQEEQDKQEKKILIAMQQFGKEMEEKKEVRRHDKERKEKKD